MIDTARGSLVSDADNHHPVKPGKLLWEIPDLRLICYRRLADVFLGIMLGIFFHMLNSLFSHIGLLQNWPPLSAAVVPSLAFLTAAIFMMWWVERR